MYIIVFYQLQSAILMCFFLWLLLLSISDFQTKHSVVMLSGRSTCSHKMPHLQPAAFILVDLIFPE